MAHLGHIRQQKLNRLARSFVESNVYLTLGTTDGLEVWTAPLFYRFDERGYFYFISQKTARHSVHIRKNPRVSFSIFDSHAPVWQGNGIQGSGLVEELEGERLLEAVSHYEAAGVRFEPKHLRGLEPYRLYRLKPESVYILDPDAVRDRRVKVYPFT